MIETTTYLRNLGPVTRLDVGEWTDETASGRVALCCARCGQIFDLSEFHRVEEDGRVVPAVKCASDACLEFGYVRLANWADPVVPA